MWVSPAVLETCVALFTTFEIRGSRIIKHKPTLSLPMRL
jgi:hypothetical protein